MSKQRRTSQTMVGAQEDSTYKTASFVKEILGVLEQKEPQEPGVSVLVVGLGGGSDCQQAYVLSRLVVDELDRAGISHQVAFATTKWAYSSEDERLPYNKVYSVKHSELPASYLNEMVNGKPRWVGTTLFEQTIPPTYHSWHPTGKVFTSPLIIEIPKPGKGSVKEQTEATNETVSCLQSLAPPNENHLGCWDVVIGVDTGGDVLGGIEDSRDVMMLQTLQRMVTRQRRMGNAHSKLFLSIVGLCVDGESFFEEMSERIATLQAGGAVLGSFPLQPCVQDMKSVCSAMADSKTPKIILACLDGKLEKATTYNRPTIDVREGGIELTSVDSVPVSSVRGTKDPMGREIGDFVQLPQRHHVDVNGVAIPSPIVPETWVCEGVLFDAEVVMRLMDFPRLAASTLEEDVDDDEIACVELKHKM